MKNIFKCRGQSDLTPEPDGRSNWKWPSPRLIFITRQICRFLQPYHAVIFHGIYNLMACFYFPYGYIHVIKRHLKIKVRTLFCETLNVWPMMNIGCQRWTTNTTQSVIDGKVMKPSHIQTYDKFIWKKGFRI